MLRRIVHGVDDLPKFLILAFVKVMRLRIVAPLAMMRTALDEDCHPHSRAVNNGLVFNSSKPNGLIGRIKLFHESSFWQIPAATET
jgi:hypothetical protein